MIHSREITHSFAKELGLSVPDTIRALNEGRVKVDKFGNLRVTPKKS